MGGPPSSSIGGGRSQVFTLRDNRFRHGRKLIREAIELAIERIELVEAVERVDWTENRRPLVEGIV